MAIFRAADELLRAGIESDLDLLVGPRSAESVAAAAQSELASRCRHLAEPAVLRQVAIYPVQFQEFSLVFGPVVKLDLSRKIDIVRTIITLIHSSTPGHLYLII